MEIHVLEVQPDKANVVFHISIPDTLNAANYSYRAALKEHNADKVAEVPNLDVSDAAEYAAIGNGEVYEFRTTIRYSANLANAQKKQAIEDGYTAEKVWILSEIQGRLEFWQMAWDTGV